MFKQNLLRSFINDDKLIIKINDDFNEDMIIKMLPLIMKVCKKDKLFLKIETNNSLLINIQEIINCKNKKVKYELIYDYVCNYLDSELIAHNYCDFINNKCIANREGYSIHSENGCCYNKKKGLCDKLINGHCTVQNSSCKFYYCRYLEKNGLVVKYNTIPQIKLFLNHKQKNAITRHFFKSREEIIKMLIDKE
jgi:hypothetical protein